MDVVYLLKLYPNDALDTFQVQMFQTCSLLLSLHYSLTFPFTIILYSLTMLRITEHLLVNIQCLPNNVLVLRNHHNEALRTHHVN